MSETCVSCHAPLETREQVYNNIKHLELYCTGCGKHVRFLKSTTPETFVMPFGKHKGDQLQNIPLDYLHWGVSNLSDEKLRNRFAAEVHRRGEDVIVKL